MSKDDHTTPRPRPAITSKYDHSTPRGNRPISPGLRSHTPGPWHASLVRPSCCSLSPICATQAPT
eukprot:11176954-Lingulodinium_polyedra.AAC.1